MTNRKPNEDADHLGFGTVVRSVMDAMNLVNLRWFLYDEARRKAWLEAQSGAARNRRPQRMPPVAGRRDQKASASDQAA